MTEQPQHPQQPQNPQVPPAYPPPQPSTVQPQQAPVYTQPVAQPAQAPVQPPTGYPQPAPQQAPVQPPTGYPQPAPQQAPAQTPGGQPQGYPQPAPQAMPVQQAPVQPPTGYPQPAPQAQVQPPPLTQPPVQQVPQAGNGQRLRVHHTYVWLGSINVLFALLIVFLFTFVPVFLGGEMTDVLGGSALGGVFALVALIVVFLLIAGLTLLIQSISYKHLSYEIGEKEFSLYSGIFNKKQVHIPYQRIQSVNQQASLFQRILGVCTVHIDTAGGSSNKAVVVPYLQNTEAERIRGELFARKQMILSGNNPVAATQQGYAAQAPQAGSNVLDAPAEILTDVRGVFGGAQVDMGTVSYEYGLSNKELILTGLSNNTGFALMVVTALAAIFGVVSQVLDTNVGNQMYNDGMSFVMRTFADNLIWVIVGALIVGMIVIWALSIIGTCLSYGGFKASRRHTRIEVEHGLLQHRFHGVDIDRVQSVIIKQSFIRRLIGYCELSLGKIDAASDSSQEQQNQVQLQQGLIIHPFVKMNRVPEILAGLVPEFADVPTDTISLPQVSLRRAIIRRGILHGNGFWLAITVAITQIILNVLNSATAGGLTDVIWYVNTFAIGFYVLCLVIAAIEIVNAVMWYRGSSFAYNRHFMQISNGGFSRESISFPRKKIQFAYTKTNPFQRISHVATVNVRSAAGIGGTTMKLLDVDEKDADKWLEWVIPGQSMLQ